MRAKPAIVAIVFALAACNRAPVPAASVEAGRDVAAGTQRAGGEVTIAGDDSIDSIGLGNVDVRLRTVYGDDYGLVVETAPGAGTKVTVRVPKFAPGVSA